MIGFLIFLIIMLIAVICLITGLLSPQWFQRLSKKSMTRKRVLGTFGLLIVVSVAGAFISAVVSSVVKVHAEIKAAQSNSNTGAGSPEQSLIVDFNYGQTYLAPMHDLEDRLIAAVEAGGVGEVDGHEITIDGSEGRFPDADKLLETIRPLLLSADCVSSVTATLRYGDPLNDRAATKEIKLK